MLLMSQEDTQLTLDLKLPPPKRRGLPQWCRWVSGVIAGAAFSLNLGINAALVADAQPVTNVHQTDATTETLNAETVALLEDVTSYLNTPEYKAQAAARDKRLRALELQLAAARQVEEKETRYQASFDGGIKLDTPTATPIYAFGQAHDQVEVRCKDTEFGAVATLASSATPDVFYKAQYLSSCTPGLVTPGTLIGETVSNLGWSEHNQLNGTAQEPQQPPLEWALSGYSGEHQAPAPVSQVDWNKVAQDIKGLFSNGQSTPVDLP